MTAEQALRELQETHEATVTALAAALELRDDETGGHAQRVAELAMALAREVAPELAEDQTLRLGFLLHDIGKIGIPDSVLLKKGPLTESEIHLMQHHTTLGEHLLSTIPHLRGVAADVISYHHERWDGTGYPWRLRGTAIPLSARIFAIADAFDAMTNDRPYQAAVPIGTALEEIIRQSGKQFDPELVLAFVPVATRLFRHRLSEPSGVADRSSAEGPAGVADVPRALAGAG
jgi:HD-GYP domain-containing protein (c-di-GMP phosphodiesterase class II)